MADCSYSRCIQQKRHIRRELQRWTKNMVYIVGLERIAEELMGRRKWKLYQESMSRNYLQPINNNVEKIRTTEDILKDQQSVECSQKQEPQEEQKGKDKKEETRSGDERLNQVDAEELKDWKPDSKCYFCVDGKLDSENNTSHGTLSPRQSDSESSDSPSDSEAPPTLTPPMGLLNNNHGNMTTIESVTSMAALASAVAALSGNSSGIPTPSLFFNSPTSCTLPHNWYLNLTRGFQSERMEVEKSGEQPLDLSSKSTSSSSPTENKMPPTIRLPQLDKQQIFKAKPRMSAIAGRRTYTEDELQAALRDIQSGKLGTRRAAVIYGIPRSTLRNKVYKLAMERERESHLNSATPLKIEDEELVDDDKELSGAEEEKEVEKALQAPLLSMADILRISATENPETFKALLQKNKEGSEMWAGLEHSAVGAYIQNVLLSSADSIPGQNTERENNPLAVLPEFIKRMIAEDQLVKEQSRSQHNNGERDVEKAMRMSPSNFTTTKMEKSSKSESDMEIDESPSNVILKIPSFKPTTSKNGNEFFRITTEPTGVISPPVTSDSGSPPILPGRGMTLKDVKDVIAKSISQKFQQAPEPLRMPPIIDMDFKRSTVTPPVVGMPSLKLQHELSRPYPSPHTKPNPSTSTPTTTATGGKGTRPKRGKYRNYDRDSLVEAVRAVQRGEMSVHRAGSYYGVPHSTLEYKVKERHLMRPRKRDPKPNPVDEKIASLKQNDLRMAANSVDKMKPVMKPPQPKFPPGSANGMKLPIFDPSMAAPIGYPPPPFPFWHAGFSHIPLDYARNPSTSSFPSSQEFFASQMMQKLQEESSRPHSNIAASPTPATLPKSARQMAESLLESTGSNGSFLDGIIRSSLESGVPTSEEKATKDEKNVAPENMSNKALLDQLCRNSRLAPLPKLNISDSSNANDENFKRLPSPLNYSASISKEETSPGLHFQSHVMDSSPIRFERANSEVHTIEISNDSSETAERNGKEEERKSTPPGRIYLKQELTKPENLKPEMLVRFRDVMQDVERNGVSESATGSASESDVAQD